ncbi:Bifunctional hemolysin/adenylate cyclase [Pandoraea anapnoica]|uniref:Bifunctional hemolysin/adenylate cyclase n=1 Tax=Pandoraea anapnoica TaxID=2508301 RepID=A0A5E5A1C0_9BURK|nr:S8 family serine peptidase [Pandoraea anapnoica]VVE67449.1 Bifunctional hemolysin/adenylate cyclase [Pandoraea anapnoica]
MSQEKQETKIVQLVFDSSMTAFTQGMQDALANALKSGDAQAKLAAKIPGAKIWLVGNLGNTLQIGMGFGEGDANLVGEALFKIVGGTLVGGSGAMIFGTLGGLLPTRGATRWIGRIGGAAVGVYFGEKWASEHVWNELVESSGKNAILDLGVARIEFSLQDTPRVLTPGGTTPISEAATVFKPIASPHDATSIDVARQTPDGRIEVIGDRWSLTRDADAVSSDHNYTVKKGENLWQLAARDGVTVEAYLQANPQITHPDLIHEGQVINRPVLSEVRNDFDLTIKPERQTANEGAGDFDAQAQRVEDGFVTGGGGWDIRSDADKLNRDQFAGGFIGNTVSTASTRILADGWRPGNGNVADPVIDRVSLQEGNSVLNGVNGAIINSIGDWASKAVPTDPLVLDLNGDGVKLTDYVSAPVWFDADNDGGSLEQTGWVSPEDGIVVLDRNGNGKIDNMSEVLSEYFAGAAGTEGASGEKRFTDGFAALKSLDSNSDGVFDQRDEAWQQVKVWVDADHNGQSWIDTNGNGQFDTGEESELKGLDELGITSIALTSEKQSGEVRDGNEILARGTFVQHGLTKEAVAANLLVSPNGSTFTPSGSGTIVQTDAGGDARARPGSAYVAGDEAGETIDVAQKGVSNGVGGKGNDVLKGDAGNNWLAGGAGADRLEGGDGDDVLLIDADDVFVNGGSGTDIVHVVGERGVMLDLAQSEVEIVQGGRGNDVLVGGGRSSVFISGGAGDDIIVGGAGNDALSGDDGDDVIDGGSGNDVIRGHRGRDRLHGGAGDDYLDGGADDDSLFGGAGNDVLRGGGGDDIIDGGEGVDIIELSGRYSEYRITPGESGIWISDTVAGRDGTDFVKNVEKANFSDITLVDIPSSSGVGLENPMPVKDVLTQDKHGKRLERNGIHLIAKEQLLANDIDFQGDSLQISSVMEAVGGTVALTDAGDVVFTPDATFSGIMSFKYTVADAKGNPAATITQISTGEAAAAKAAVFLKTTDLPSDELVTDQWYLGDANILPVWKDYSGKGVRIGQFETNGSFGTSKEILDYRHSDLKDNIDSEWLAQASPERQAGAGDDGKISEHATLVAGVMVAARNGTGGVGVAYGATLGGHWLAAKDMSSLARMKEYDVVNHSWGSSERFSLKFDRAEIGALSREYADALNHGREGLGTVIVMAAGNDRAKGGNANYSSLSNSRSSIIVGAINAKTDLGLAQVSEQPFSSRGASILVSAPGSNVTSTSSLQQNANGSTFGSDAKTVQGTSFATPIVSGIVALMLEANPRLGYRDVQEILALTARKVDDPNTDWQTNGATRWNGGGMHVSHDYGYGQVDARAAVRLAENWIDQQTAGNLYGAIKSPTSVGGMRAIPDGDMAGIKNTLRMSGVGATTEHVEVRVRLTHARPGDLIIKLISPSGTESILMDRPGLVPGDATSRGDSSFGDSNMLDFVFGSARHRGEPADGDWTLQVIDAASGDTGVLIDWSMNAMGRQGTANDQYVYTDEFADVTGNGRDVLEDGNGGINTINVAAVSSGSRIDLFAGNGTIAGKALTIQNSANFANVIGGESDDVLIGNDNANVLVGGQGNDTLNGNGGWDILFGGSGNDTLTGGTGPDFFVVEHASGSNDTITDFSVGEDRIVLSALGTDIFTRLTFTQMEADAHIGLPDGQTLILKNINASQLSAGDFLTMEEGLRVADIVNGRMFAFGNDSSESEAVLPDNGVNYWAGDGDDRVFGGSGNDIIFGGAGNDVLVGERSTDGLVGGNDVLHGGAGNDVVRGGPGNDILWGDEGLDYLNGDAGDDILYLEGDQGLAEFADGDLFAPSLTFQGGSLTGAAVAGGQGADRFVVVEDRSPTASNGLMKNLIDDFEPFNFGEKIDLSKIRAVSSFKDLTFSNVVIAGQQFLRVFLGPMASGTQYITLRGVNQAFLSERNFIFGQHDTLQPNVHISGSSGNDTLVGDAGGNILDGRAGADVMEGRTGDDTYFVDDAGDIVTEHAGGGFDTVKASISYTLPDEVEALELIGDAAINGTGNAKVNRITGNDAANMLDGGAGADVLVGGKGNDVYIVDDTSDRVLEREGEGADTVLSSVSFTLGDHVENLSLTGTASINATGNALANRLVGNAGDNRILGGDGDDWLDGGAGNDYLIGGAGSDTYLFGRGSGNDAIFNHDAGQDKRDVLQMGADLDGDQIWFQREGNNLEISVLGAQDRVTIREWYSGPDFRLDQVRLADGRAMTANQVELLVDAMAEFSPPAAGQTSLPADYRATLAPLLAANWQ